MKAPSQKVQQIITALDHLRNHNFGEIQKQIRAVTDSQDRVFLQKAIPHHVRKKVFRRILLQDLQEGEPAAEQQEGSS